MMPRPHSLALFTILLLALSSVAWIPQVSAQPQFDFTGILRAIDYDAIYRHVSYLAGLGSRVTGYEGSREAAAYIASYFKGILGEGNVIVQNYSVVIPLDKGATITVIKDGRVVKIIRAYNLWPNYIQTCKAEGLRGRLVYAGKGELSDFNGLEVEGSIVLLDFNSGGHWLNAARLGAKAVIFIEPEDTSRVEALAKFTTTPLHFPRLYVSREDGEFLRRISREPNVTVVIDSDMEWVEVEAQNIIGVVKGAEFPDDIIVVAAHYDTWSVVPRLAPGADEAVSVAALMELARYFAQHRPKRTMWFVALSGHWEALAGAREFVEEYFFSSEVMSGEKRMWMFVGLDFSTDGHRVALLYRGHMYDFGASGPMLRWLKWLQPRIFKVYLPLLEEQTGRTYEVRDGFHPSGTYGWWASIPEPYMLDSEPYAVAHGLSFTIRTDEVLRLHFCHPFNTLEKVRLENLKPQLEVAAAIIYGLANEDEIGMKYSEVSPSRYLFTAAGGDLAGFMTVKGKVWVFNITKGWYTSVPNAIVVACRVDVSYSSYPFSRIVTISDENGTFEIHGISGYGYGHGYGRVDVWHFEAYKLDGRTGVITYAPDQGQYGRLQIKFDYEVNRQPYEVTTVVFRAIPVEMFDIVDPTTYRPRVFMNPVFETTLRTWSGRPWILMLYDARGVSQFVTWGLFDVGYENTAIVFLPPRARGLLIFKSGPDLANVGLLTNASLSSPEGEGFGGLASGRLVIPFTAYRFAHDTLMIAESRYGELKRFMIRDPVTEFYLNQAREHLEAAARYFKQRVYDRAYAEAFAAWSYAVGAYSNVMRMIYDTVNTSLMVFLILIFFALFFERLTISATGVRAMLTVAAIFIIVFLIYINVHPAPKIASNVLIGPLSLTSLVLFIVTLAVFYDKVRVISREFRERLMGMHVIEKMPVSSLMTIAMSQAPRNLRKHPLRSILVFVTVAATIFSMTALTSVTPTLEAKAAPQTGITPLYQGMLIKRDLQFAPDIVIEPEIVMLLKAVAGWEAKIIPRAWCYPPSVGGEGVYLEVRSNVSSYRVKAIIGMVPEELDLIKNSLVVGDWFEEWDYASCILPRNVAEQLNVTVGDVVEIYSMKLLVRGVFEPSVLNRMKDFDNYAMTPANPDNIQAITIKPVTTQTMEIYPLSWEQVIIVPYKLALDLGGFLASVTMEGRPEVIEEVGRDLAVILHELKIYYASDERVYVPSPVGWYSMAGLEFLLAPLIIASLNVASMILASVKERESEIKVYSAVGLAPAGIVLIFLVESIMYALIGCVFGYFLGVGANILMIKLGMLPENYVVNFSSMATVIGIGVPIVAVMLSAIYPSYMASRLITPSYERKWKIPTRPKGDIWEIPLPFSAESEDEALGMLAYIGEYLRSRTVESEDPFIVQSVKLSPEDYSVTATMQLIPLESGVWQAVKISAVKSEGRWVIQMTIKRQTGVREVWASKNYMVADAIRKQLLLWRSLPLKTRESYIRRGREARAEASEGVS